MTIWKDISVFYKAKEIHVKKIGGVVLRAFAIFPSEIPVGNFNDITGKFEPCINTRGRAYGTRKRLCFRKKRD